MSFPFCPVNLNLLANSYSLHYTCMFTVFQRKKFSSFYYPDVGIIDRQEREERREDMACEKEISQDDVCIKKTQDVQDLAMLMANVQDQRDQIKNFVQQLVNCSDENCEEDDHTRHHAFIDNVEEFLMKERVNFCFGALYLDVKMHGILAKELIDVFLIKRTNPKRIYSDWWMSISDMDNVQLERIFKANRLAAKDYVMHVLFKEVINYLAMEHLGLPYQLADERGRSTEVSKIEELKIKKIRKH
uniref:Uncharacterized protein LOC111120571 n=1 Tax=Crassostrea virginica TaxID=6565 RepID=A0A8B8CML1_CRAVI|nr:uncharacterized protein LOC111120571 [Crassostrea virginica]